MTDQINSTLMYYSNMGQTWGKGRSTPQRRERSAGSSTLQKQFATYSTAALSKPGRQRSAQPSTGKTLSSAILFSGPGFSSVAYTPLLQLTNFRPIHSFSRPIFLSTSLLEGYHLTFRGSPTCHAQPSTMGQGASQ